MAVFSHHVAKYVVKPTNLNNPEKWEKLLMTIEEINNYYAMPKIISIDLNCEKVASRYCCCYSCGLR